MPFSTTALSIGADTLAISISVSAFRGVFSLLIWVKYAIINCFCFWARPNIVKASFSPASV